MGEREPLRQLSCGLIGSRPVKRHHGRRDAWHPQQLGAPAVTDEHDLYEVRAPADGFFEAVNGHGVISERRRNGVILRFGRSRSSEARREGGVHNVADAKRRSILPKKNFLQQALNNFCTRHQHFFHNPHVARHVSSRARGYNEAPRRVAG